MKSNIDLNTRKRMEARNELRKIFYKLMNNNLFGKTMENIKNRAEDQLDKKEEQDKKLAFMPKFESFKLLSENLIGYHKMKINEGLINTIYLRMHNLELCKTLTYDIHYNYIKIKYNENTKFFIIETDSLCYCIQTKDVYKDMKRNIQLFDTSDFPKDHKLFSDKNKKVSCEKNTKQS